MVFKPLTKEQYEKALSAGFGSEQIVEMEKRRKEAEPAVEEGLFDDFREGLTDVSARDIPFAGGVVELKEMTDLYRVSQKVKGGTATKEELSALQTYYDEQIDKEKLNLITMKRRR